MLLTNVRHAVVDADGEAINNLDERTQHAVGVKWPRLEAPTRHVIGDVGRW
jgi:hypothetical protein